MSVLPEPLQAYQQSLQRVRCGSLVCYAVQAAEVFLRLFAFRTPASLPGKLGMPLLEARGCTAAQLCWSADSAF